MQCVSLLSQCCFTVFHLNLKRPCSGLPARRFCFTSKAGYIILAKWRSGWRAGRSRLGLYIHMYIVGEWVLRL